MADIELQSGTSLPSSPVPRPAIREVIAGIASWLAGRLFFALLVLLAIVLLTFFGLDMARGSPLGPAAANSLEQSRFYLTNVLQGELGVTAAASPTALSLPVAEVLPAIVGRSLGLLGVSLLLASLVGVAAGLYAARWRHSNRSLGLILASIAGVSAPSFFVALLLQIAAITWTRRTGSALVPVGGFGWDKHLILPALVLAARPIAQITRVTFVTVGDILGQDYVRTAYSKGLRGYHIRLHHVLRNAAVPILTTVGLSLRFMLSSLPVVEFFFGWPGAGFTLLRAISERDDALAVALLLSLGLFFLLVNLLLELAYYQIDPRLRQAPDHMTTAERKGLRARLRDLWASLQDTLSNNALASWWRRRRGVQEASPFGPLVAQNRRLVQDEEEAARRFNWRAWRRGTLGNLPFVAGLLLVLILAVVFLFGPQLAPMSPYDTRGLTFEGGEFRVPPFAPDDEYLLGSDVLGRDILSLILAGAQQTLLLVGVVVATRLFIGFVLGALAGWFSTTWVDRLIVGAAEVLAAFPTLLLAMILILALGIREGFRPFLLALSVIGWGEIMQFVRGEVMALRPQPFIESAVAVGASTRRIISYHVFPNLLAALISLAALEMGATLMLLGELGFIGIFIGGGAFAELDVGRTLYHYSDVPEWGSLLSNVRSYARAYPWTALYPALAFFIAIVAFNLLGEGLRRLINVVGVEFTRLLNRYTFAMALLLVAGFGWFRSNSGPMGYYRNQAAAFDGERALQHVTALAEPQLEGRALGTAGLDEAAEYIAGQFQALGLQPGGQNSSYFQARPREFLQLDSVPRLEIDDGGEQPVYREDFNEFAGAVANSGEVEGEVRVLGVGPLLLTGGSIRDLRNRALQDYDFSGNIVMVLQAGDLTTLENSGARGILVVAGETPETEEAAVLRRHQSLSPLGSQLVFDGSNVYVIGNNVPIFWIGEETANRILAGTGEEVGELRRRDAALGQDEVFTVETGRRVSLALEATPRTGLEAVNVIGQLPGESAELDSQMIVVLAQYDAPPLGPGSAVYPNANDNASGVAVMLEVIRTMRDSGYRPNKTFLFVAYSGEGWDQGNRVRADVERYLSARLGFASAYTVEAIVELRGAGAGSGERVQVVAGGSLRLTELFERAARRMGAPATRLGAPVDVSVVFRDQRNLTGGQIAPEVGIGWLGWEATSRTEADTVEAISAQRLEAVGRATTLALMTLGREINY